MHWECIEPATSVASVVEAMPGRVASAGYAAYRALNAER